MLKPQSQVLYFSASVGISKLASRYSLPPAAVFACFYLLALVWYVRNGNHTQLRYSITFSCLVHFVAFVIRADLAYGRPPSVVPPLSAAQDILFNAGFLFLLYPAYLLILKLEKFTQTTTHLALSPLLDPFRIRPLFRLALLIGATLRIMATSHVHSNSRNAWAPETIYALNEASHVVFAVLAVIVVSLTIDYVRSYGGLCLRQEYDQDPATPTSSVASLESHAENPENPASHAPVIALLISVLLLIRQTFAMTTMNPPVPPSYSPQPSYPTSNPRASVSEGLWYTLLATPELLVVVLFAWPHLEPPHAYRVVQLTEEEGEEESV